MFRKIQSYITIFLLISCTVLIFLLQKSCNEISSKENLNDLYKAAQDSLHKTRNELGQEKTTTSLLYSEISDLKKINFEKDSSIAKLKKIVNKNTISATVFGTSTSNTISPSTTSSESKDSIIEKNDSIVYVKIYPEYVTGYANRWENFNVRANKDTILIKYKVFNEYEFTQEWQKQKKGLFGVFSQKVPVVTVKNLNPHTETLELKSFAIKSKKYSRLKNILIGMAAGSTATFIVLNKTNMNANF